MFKRFCCFNNINISIAVNCALISVDSLGHVSRRNVNHLTVRQPGRIMATPMEDAIGGLERATIAAR